MKFSPKFGSKFHGAVFWATQYCLDGNVKNTFTHPLTPTQWLKYKFKVVGTVKIPGPPGCSG